MANTDENASSSIEERLERELASTREKLNALSNELASKSEALKESVEHQTALSEVLAVISESSSDVRPVFDAIAKIACRLCQADHASIFRIRDGACHLEASQAAPDFVQHLREHPIPLDGNFLTTRAVRDLRVMHIADVDAASKFDLSLAKKSRSRTLFSVPLERDGSAVGVITMGRYAACLFTENQVNLVKVFAKQAAIAIENARLVHELRETLQQQTATSEVLQVINRSATDLDAVLNTLVDSAARLCDADAWLFRRNGDYYHWAASAGFSPEHHEKIRAFFLQNPFRPHQGATSARAALQQRIVHIHDVLADPDYTWSQAQEVAGFRSTLAVPLLRETETTGVLTLTRGEVKPFSDQQIALIRTFADQAVIAIENARLFEAEQERSKALQESLEFQAASSEVLGIISQSPTNAQPVFSKIADSAAKLCASDVSIVHLCEGDQLYPVATWNWTSAAEMLVGSHLTRLDRSHIAGRAILERQIVHVRDVLEDAEYSHELAIAGKWRAVLSVPMMREGIAVGAIAVAKAEPISFTDRQIHLLRTFADQAVIAIENARLFEEVQARTRQLTQSLDDLKTAQDRLVQTEKLASLGQLTAGIAHEIKNPLNFVNNFSSLSAELVDELQVALGKAAFDDPSRVEVEELMVMLKDNLNRVVQHGKRADSIVKNMLLHSRQGVGEFRSIDINTLVDESLNLAYHGARAENPEFNISLDKEFDPAAGEAQIYPQEITRVLLNLISNGFYATHKRLVAERGSTYEPALSVATTNLGNSVEITIRDNGTGIPPDVVEKMFDPFFTTKPTGEGTGLGLSLSHDIIVKQHSGSINVESLPGQFTEFHVVLPRNASTTPKPESIA